MKMTGAISKSSRFVLLLYFIIALIVGVWFFFAPQLWNAVTGWPSEIASGRMLGAACVALAIGALLAYRAKSWEQIEIFVLLIIIWGVMSVVGMLWNILTMTLPFAAWFMDGLAALFLLLFCYVYYSGRR